MSQTQQFSPAQSEGEGGVASGAQAQAGEVAEQAQEKAAEVAEQAQEKAQHAAAQMQDKLREQLDQRSSQAATQIDGHASDLRSVGESLRQQGKEGPAKAADQLAQYAEKVGGYLREKDSHALLADVEDLSRRQPWAIAAGGLAVGFLASRFLKASSRQRYEGRLTVPRPAGVYTAPPRAGGNGIGEGGNGVSHGGNGISEWSQAGYPGSGSGPVM
jgi:polyhydroxyalkanoate synthesis regulator phasin